MNNKGQALAIFAIFLPFIIGVGIYAVDLSYAKYNDIKLDNISKIVVKYGVNHINEDPRDKMIELIKENDNELDGYDIDINKEEGKVEVTLNDSVKGIFGNIIGKKIYEQKSNFIGYKQNERIIIEDGARWKKMQLK